jgi:hypothetical protein
MPPASATCFHQSILIFQLALMTDFVGFNSESALDGTMNLITGIGHELTEPFSFRDGYSCIYSDNSERRGIKESGRSDSMQDPAIGFMWKF